MWRDRVVWITGTSSGIGEALAPELAPRGARPLLSARRRERLEALSDSLTEPGRHAMVPLDLADAAAIPSAVDAALRRR